MARMNGSFVCSIPLGSGYKAGLSIIVVVPSFMISSYCTDGAVSIKERSYSRSSLSCTTSR